MAGQPVYARSLKQSGPEITAGNRAGIPFRASLSYLGSNRAGESRLRLRLRKLVGMIALVTLVLVYAVLATAVAVARLAESGPLVHLAYFFFTGLLWVLPAMLIIRWMAGPKPKGDG